VLCYLGGGGGLSHIHKIIGKLTRTAIFTSPGWKQTENPMKVSAILRPTGPVLRDVTPHVPTSPSQGLKIWPPKNTLDSLHTLSWHVPYRPYCNFNFLSAFALLFLFFVDRANDTTTTKRGHLYILVHGPIYLLYDVTPSRQKNRAKIVATHVVRPSNTTLVLFILCPPVSLSSFLKA
jgi:hypothetical protein